MTSRRSKILFVLLLLLGLLPGCVGSGRVETSTGAGRATSPTMLPGVYQEDGAVVFLAVDTRASQYAEDTESMFPLGLSVANRSRRTLRFERESFTFETDSGQRYPLVSVEEFNRDYRRASNDSQLARPFLEGLQTKFSEDKFRSRAFFPAPGAVRTSVAVDSFELGTTEWSALYLYFPMPVDGLHGRRFKLLVSVEGEPDPFVVTFQIR